MATDQTQDVGHKAWWIVNLVTGETRRAFTLNQTRACELVGWAEADCDVRPLPTQRTDGRGLAERKHSVTLRISELRKALRDAEMCAADIDAQIEAKEYARESGADSVAAE